MSCGYKNAYFGYTDNLEEGSWYWINDESSSYTNWHSKEPSNDYNNENYAMYYHKFSDGTWNDGDFDVRTENGGHLFICEWDSDHEEKSSKDGISKAKGSIKSDYQAVISSKLDQAKSNDPTRYDITYAFADIDENGVSELLIKVGTCEADYNISIYSYDKDEGAYLLKDGLSGGHTGFYWDNDNDCLALVMQHQGVGSVDRIHLKDGEINENTTKYGIIYSESDMGELTHLDRLSYSHSDDSDWYYYYKGKNVYKDASLFDLIDEYTF